MALVFWMLKVLLHTKVWSFQKHFDIKKTVAVPFKNSMQYASLTIFPLFLKLNLADMNLMVLKQEIIGLVA